MSTQHSACLSGCRQQGLFHAAGVRRRGFLLIELAAAVVVLIAALVVLMKLLTWTAVERRAAERRGWAIQEAANAMETLTALPRGSLDLETARKVATLSPGALSALADGRMNVELVESGPNLVRIAVTIRWNGVAGREETPVRLTSWVGKREVGR